MNIRKNGVIARNVCVAAALASVLLATPSEAVRVSTTGMGQVLLFPYYTVQNDNVSLISLVNTTTQGKAVRLNLRDARGGFVVAQLNVYLSAKDVWTAAIVGSSDSVRLISNDLSCTAPLVTIASGGLPLTQLAFTPPSGAAPVPSPESRREGYVEVIEMATIPNTTPTGVSITHVNGIAPCNRGSVTSVSFEPPAVDLKAPSGGLTGTLSIVNVGQGMLVSTAPTALENFWLTGPGASAPRVWPANSTQPGLDSGGDRDAYLHADSAFYSANAITSTARFASSLDAVSAVLMTGVVSSEYATTTDNTIATTTVITLPTKPYYIRRANTSPFQNAWNDATRQSCDDFAFAEYDREEGTPIAIDDFPTRPPGPRNLLCYVANTIPVVLGTVSSTGYATGGGAPDASFLNAQFPFALPSLQNGGRPVTTPGREGGWLELGFTSTTATLTPSEASVVRVTGGTPEIVTAPRILLGLPVIGFTLSQSAFKLGSPQQNFADAVPLRTKHVLATGQP
jgi:hypothetical protein